MRFARAIAAAVALSFALPAAAPARAEDACTVQGRVLDGAKRGVERARVALTPIGANGRPLRERTRSVATDATGQFAVGCEEGAQRLRLDVRAKGFAPALLDGIEPTSRVLELGAIPLLPIGELAGTVLGPDQKPLAGAEIWIRTPFDREAEPSEFAPVATTGADGTFRVGELPRCEIELAVAAPGAADALFFGLLPGGPEDAPMELRLDASPPLAGRVLGKEGAALERAAVEVLRGGAPVAFFRGEVECDDDGTFRVEGLPADRSALSLRASAFACDSVELPLENLPPAIELLRAPVARVTALANDGSTPLPIAELRFDVYSKVDEGWRRREGRARAADAVIEEPHVWRATVPPGDVARVAVVTESGLQAMSGDIDLKQANAVLEAEVRFPEDGAIDGIVLDAAGAPAGGARVELCRGGEGGAKLVILRAGVAGADGSFRFVVPVGSYMLRASTASAIAPPRPANALPPGSAAGGAPKLELRLEQGGAIEGRLTLNGAAPEVPVALAALRFERFGRGGSFNPVASVSTGADGRYRFDPVPPGRILVVPARPADAGDGSARDLAQVREVPEFREWPWSARVKEGETAELDLDFQVALRSWLYGEIRVNGRARPGAQITLGQPALGQWQTARSDASGRYRVRVEGGGSFQVQVLDPPLSYAGKVEVNAGADQRSDVDISAGRVQGRLESAADGLALAPLRVMVEEPRVPTPDDESPWRLAAQVLSEPDGTFAVAEVPAGRYRASVLDVENRFAGAATELFQVTAGQTAELPLLRIPRAGTLKAVMAAASGEALPFASLELEAAEGAPPLPRKYVGWFVENTATVLGLPPGKLRLHLRTYGKWTASPDQEIEIPADGSTAEVLFTVTPEGG